MKWKPTGVWKEEITKKIRKYLQANEKKKEKENTTYQNSQSKQGTVNTFKRRKILNQ
jgi:hypothetical protein